MDFKKQYDLYLSAVEEKINEYFAPKDVKQKSVLDAMHYAITAGGKRIRPVLTLAAAELCGADLDDAARVALSVECIHNYSLIHDDLPCMDDDDLRRGRPTCHKVFGECTALLAGDGLLNSAFEILSDIKNFKTLDAERLLKITRELSVSSGVFGMIGGQVTDIENENKDDVTLDDLIYMHAHKTGALIKAATLCGAMCGNFDDEKISSLSGYSSKLGLAFQIKDDILDVTGNEELLGKPIGSDLGNGKNTFVTLLSLEEAKKSLAEITDKAKRELEPFGDKAWFLRELADFLIDRSY